MMVGTQIVKFSELLRLCVCVCVCVCFWANKTLETYREFCDCLN